MTRIDKTCSWLDLEAGAHAFSPRCDVGTVPPWCRLREPKWEDPHKSFRKPAGFTALFSRCLDNVGIDRDRRSQNPKTTCAPSLNK